MIMGCAPSSESTDKKDDRASSDKDDAVEGPAKPVQPPKPSPEDKPNEIGLDDENKVCG